MRVLMSGQAGPNVMQKIDQNRQQATERQRAEQEFEALRRQREANLRGTQLGNTKSALDIARSGRPQPIDPYKAAQIEKIKFEIEQKRNQPKESPFGKISDEAKRFLPPEALVNPESIPYNEQVRLATEAVGKLRAQPKEKSLAERQFEYQQQKDKMPKAPKRGAAQLDADGFLDRMQTANEELQRITQGANPDDPSDDFSPTGWEAVRGASNVTASTEMQQYKQAASNWIRANLRKESGAAIGVDEMEQEFATYFPQFGDDPEVIEQKARARAVTENAMRKAAGIGESDAPSAGTVQDGYVFQGGDPADPNSWIKQ